MDAFTQEKVKVLERLGSPDKSRKGGVDEAAWPMINTLNSFDDYYTTSSCAGRINLFKEPANGKKYDAEWLYVTHDEADLGLVNKTLESLPSETIWLRMEPPIFHVACRTQIAAEKLLKVCQANGWKRSGIISVGGKGPKRQRVMVEIVGNERIDTPLAIDGELAISKGFIKFLVEKANEKLAVTRNRLETLKSIFEKEL